VEAVVIPRRIIPRDELRGTAIERPCSSDPQHAIRLDGTRYTCGRAVRRNDRVHDGIHDAFQTHGDGGAIRW
jgi:hypothetical protein